MPDCPFGVIDRRKKDGTRLDVTLCYDRLARRHAARMGPKPAHGVHPFPRPRRSPGPGPTAPRLATLREAGEDRAHLYGHDPGDGVGGDGAFFLLLDEPEVYGLPPDPVVTTRDLPTPGVKSAWPRAPRRPSLGGGLAVRSRWAPAGARRRSAGPAAGAADGDGAAGASSPWCPIGVPLLLRPADVNAPTGRRPTSPGTCSSAASPAPRRCWPRAPSSPAAPTWPGWSRSAPPAPSAFAPSRLSTIWAGPGDSPNMLRVFKPTSPMSVGSWLLAGYGPVAGAAAASEVTGHPAPAGTAAGSAPPAGPAVATYTAALIATRRCRPGTRATGSCRFCSPARRQRRGRRRPARHPRGRRRTRP